VGGGFVLAGKVWHGMSGMAAELGHLNVEQNGAPCNCGSRGCLEQYASATAVKRMAMEAVSAGKAPEMARAMKAGQDFNSKVSYQQALDGAEPAPRIEVGASRSRPGTVAAAVAGYLGSTAFANLATGTQAYRRQLLDRFRAEHGDKRIATLEHKHVDGLIAARASTPGAATNLLIALRALMRHAVMCGLRSTGGHHSA